MSKPLTLEFASSVINNFRHGYAKIFGATCTELSDQQVLNIYNKHCNDGVVHPAELIDYPLLQEEAEYDQAVLAEMYYAMHPEANY